MTNKEVAGAWLYGQLLHEDELRRSYGAGISAEEMLLNATKTVCSEMLATVEALHLIERLVADGPLALSEDLFTEPVSVTATEWSPQIARAYTLGHVRLGPGKQGIFCPRSTHLLTKQCQERHENSVAPKLL